MERRKVAAYPIRWKCKDTLRKLLKMKENLELFMKIPRIKHDTPNSDGKCKQ